MPRSMPRQRGETPEEYITRLAQEQQREAEQAIDNGPSDWMPTITTSNLSTAIHQFQRTMYGDDASASPPEPAPPPIDRPLPPVVQEAIDDGTIPRARLDRVRRYALEPNRQLRVAACPRTPLHATEVEAEVINISTGDVYVAMRMTTFPERGAERYERWGRVRRALYAAWDDIRDNNPRLSSSALRSEREERVHEERRATAEERIEGIEARLIARARTLDTFGSPVYIDGLRTYEGAAAITLYINHRGSSWDAVAVTSSSDGRSIRNRTQALGPMRSRDELLHGALQGWARSMAENGFEVGEGDDEGGDD